jgi:hypothetical protein
MQKPDFLTQLIGNTARARIIKTFVFDSDPRGPREVAKRAGVSIETAKKEITFFEKLGVITKGKYAIKLKTGKKIAGKQKEDVWILDEESKYAAALSKFVHEVSPMRYDSIIEALKRSGKISAIVLSGNFLGDPSRPADILVAGDALSDARLEAAIKNLELEFGREIRYACFTTPELRYRLTIQDRLVRDTIDYPHLVLLDRARLL